MYIDDRQSPGSQYPGAASLGRLGWDGLSYGHLGQVGLPLPTVSAFTFRNTGLVDPENCCATCGDPPATGGRTNLGVGLRGNGAVSLAAANGMELAFTISGHRPGMEYDITRTRRNSIWQRVGGVWTRLEPTNPMGTNDDHFATDECLRLGRTNRIFAIDTPGWPLAALPAAAGTIFGGLNPAVVSNVAATDLVFRLSFAEWVIARSQAEGIPWTHLRLPPFQNGAARPHVYWHSITWLVRNPAGNPAGVWVLGPRSEIQLGSLSAAVINSPPA